MGISTWHCAVSAEPAVYGPYCSQNRYGVLRAGFIPFAMGGLFYFHRDTLSAWIKANWRVVIAVLIGAHAAMFFWECVSWGCAQRHHRPLPRHRRDNLPPVGLAGRDRERRAGLFR
jgi:hypothetical protein